MHAHIEIYTPLQGILRITQAWSQRKCDTTPPPPSPISCICVGDWWLEGALHREVYSCMHATWLVSCNACALNPYTQLSIVLLHTKKWLWQHTSIPTLLFNKQNLNDIYCTLAEYSVLYSLQEAVSMQWQLPPCIAFHSETARTATAKSQQHSKIIRRNCLGFSSDL